MIEKLYIQREDELVEAGLLIDLDTLKYQIPIVISQ